MKMKKFVSVMLAVLLLVAVFPTAAVAEETYVTGYFDTGSDNDRLYKLEIKTGSNRTTSFYFQSFVDAMSAAEKGFLYNNQNNQYYVGPFPPDNIPELNQGISKNWDDQYPIILYSEKNNNAITITEDITVDSEVHFVLASQGNNMNTAPQTVSFTGKIVVQESGALIQDYGGKFSSAEVTLKNPIEVKSGGELKLVRAGGEPDAKTTTWKTTPGNEPVISVEAGGKVTLTDVNVGDLGSNGPAIVTSGEVAIQPYNDADGNYISKIQVKENGSLTMSDTNGGIGVTNVDTIDVENGGNVLLNRGTISNLSLANGSSATIDDAIVTKISLSPGAAVTLGENFGKTGTAFNFPVGTIINIVGKSYTAIEQAGSVDKNGNVSFPGGVKMGEKTLPANTMVTAGGIIVNGTKEMPATDEKGNVTIPSSGGFVIKDDKITNMPCGGSVSIDGEVSVTPNPATDISLDKTYVNLYHNATPNTVKLTATVTPENTTDTVAWSTDNERVATVDQNGLVTAVGNGRAVITAIAGEKSATCTVNVSTYVAPAPTYGITVKDADNGTATCYARAAEKGAVVTVTVKPDVGYALDKLTVTDAGGKTVDVTKVDEKTYTFVMPGSKVTVEAVFAPTTVEPSGLPFTDVSTSDWFYGAVKFVYENGLMDGVGNNLFAPNATLNRAMAVTILYRLEGSPAVTTDAGFNDVAAGTWYTDAVNWAAANNIVNGVEGNNFDPTGSLTREQMATVLYRYAQYKGADVSASGDLSGFVDSANVSSWAADAVKWAVGSGLVNGVEGNALAPKGTSTRAQAATVLMRFVG